MSGKSLSAFEGTRKTTDYNTPATVKADKGQRKNNGGGYSFVLTDQLQRAQRFLILGSEGSFYQTGQKMTEQSAKVIRELAESELSGALVDLIVEISTQGRAPKQQPALFALAIASSFGTTEAKQYALSKLPAVARTGTTLFEFVSYVTKFRSWGRALKTAVGDWYTTKERDKLAYQMVKYQQREGWTHARLLRLSHPKLDDTLADWAIRGTADAESLPDIVRGFEDAKTASEDELIALVGFVGLTWEMVPSEKRSAKVWQALLPNMPLGALLRQLPTLTRNGLLGPMSVGEKMVVARLSDEAELHRARIHPISVLTALKSYSSGGRVGLSRGASFTPNQKVVDALNKAFYLAFKNVEPTGKNFLIGVDVSGSMSSWGWGREGEILTPAEIAGALSLVTVATEPNSHVVGFATNLVELPITPSMRLDQVLHETSKRNFGSTNPSAAIEWALRKNVPVDTFVIITDNDVNTGHHPHLKLAEYRRKTGIDAKLIVLAVTASKFSIADPNDPGMLDIAGFDSAVPQVIAEFSKGNI